MLSFSCFEPARRAVPALAPIARCIGLKRLPLIFALFVSFSNVRDDGSIAIERCVPENPSLEPVVPGHRIACWVDVTGGREPHAEPVVQGV